MKTKEKIKRTIKSCKTQDQLASAYKLLKNCKDKKLIKKDIAAELFEVYLDKRRKMC